jgi:hypothetical protein
MKNYAVIFLDLTMPDRFSRTFARQAVAAAITEMNRALTGVAQFELTDGFGGTPPNRRIYIQFDQAAEDIAELRTERDGSHIVVLDRDADWDIRKVFWSRKRRGSVSTETLLWHEFSHIAEFTHSDDPRSIRYFSPEPRSRLTGRDEIELQKLFRNLA